MEKINNLLGSLFKKRFKGPRYDRKYIADPQDIQKILDSLLEEMERAYYRANNTQFVDIKTLYFDTPSLSFFQDHFSSKNERYKFRIRWYNPDGNSEHQSCLLELKIKNLSGQTDKIRVHLDPDNLARVISGKTVSVTKDFVKANPIHLSMLKIWWRVHQINKVISRFNPRPVCSTSFRRYAFESSSGDLRLTVDTGLSYEASCSVEENVINDIQNEKFWRTAKLRLHGYCTGQAIVEVKHFGNIPKWLSNLIWERACPQPFSKYCYAIIATFLETTGAIAK
ncbi:MAG: polyphosphate polymerase domain-containing protein [Candidatus Nomurabacteria bacterium]|nr:polyphosphate polymerase domain-containing protein [Candidatus Nomurabacteria bacterium]